MSTARSSGSSPTCGSDSMRDGVSGSSSSACTASLCTVQAATGSSSTGGPFASCTPAPDSRNAGNHSTRCRTTSRAAQPSTGAGRSQASAGTPRTRSVKPPAIQRCSSAGPVIVLAGFAEQLVELFVGLADAVLHAAGDHGVALLDRVADRLGDQAGAATEVLEGHGLQRHAVRLALVGERLHDAVDRPHLVEDAVEGVLAAVVAVDVAVRAAGTRVEPV